MNDHSQLFIIDGIAFHSAANYFSAIYEKKKRRVNFKKIELFAQSLLPGAKGVLMSSVDQESDKSRRFTESVSETTDLLVYAEHYVRAYHPLPPGKCPTHEPVQSMASRICYVLGRLSAQDKPKVLVFSHSFDVFWALATLKKQQPEAEVGMAFFSRLWDHRITTQIKEKHDVAFFKLDEHAEDFFNLPKQHYTPEENSIWDAI